MEKLFAWMRFIDDVFSFGYLMTFIYYALRCMKCTLCSFSLHHHQQGNLVEESLINSIDKIAKEVDTTSEKFQEIERDFASLQQVSF